MITDAKKQTRHRTEVLRLAGILILLSHAVNTVSILFCNLTLHRDHSQVHKRTIIPEVAD